MSTLATDTTSLISAFNGWDSSKIAAVNSPGRWAPPTGDYEMELTKIEFKEKGLSYKDKAGNEVIRPKLIFGWTVLSGEFAGKSFETDQIINNPEQAEKDTIREMQEKAIGRVRGLFEVVTGQQVPPGPAGFVHGLQETAKIISKAPFPLKGNVYVNDREVVKDGKTRKYRDVNVTAIEPLNVAGT